MLINEAFGWFWIIFGFLSGMVIGMLFHDEQWLGGYASHSRRLIRLGHISLVGLGMLNILFAHTVGRISLSLPLISIASWAFIFGGISMPICCGLMAWDKRWHLLFALPVTSLLIGAVLTFWGLIRT
jgi:hypothetical protein